MKKILFCIGCVLILTTSFAQNRYWPGRFNNQGFGNSFNNQWGAQFGNSWNQLVYSYNYNGFNYNNNGVNLSVNTPWGGGSLSFPIGTIQNGSTYAYTPPAPNRTYYNYNNATSSYGQGLNYSYQKTNRRKGKPFEINYSDPDLAMNKANSSSVTTSTTCHYHWVVKMCSVDQLYILQRKNDAGVWEDVIGSDGQKIYKTEQIQKPVLVLE